MVDKVCMRVCSQVAEDMEFEVSRRRPDLDVAFFRYVCSHKCYRCDRLTRFITGTWMERSERKDFLESPMKIIWPRWKR